MQEKEPSLLDYLKSLLEMQPDKYQHYLRQEDIQQDLVQPAHTVSKQTGLKFNWLVFLSLVLALIGQCFLEPIRRIPGLGIFLYCLAGSCLVGFYFLNRDQFLELPHKIANWRISQEVRIGLLFPATVLLAAAFWFFQDNQFTLLNVLLWIGGLLFFILAVWQKPAVTSHRKFHPDRFLGLVLLVAVLSILFRVMDLQGVPSEMFSDHAEKLLDVADVLDGKTSIFFTRNTGRESLQFYLTALIIKIFNTDISFLSLKLGTVLAGLATLPFIYLIGKELGGKWTGLAALFMAGIGYWPNVISRVALRYAFYPLFTAATFYYLIKGLRTSNRNDFLITGLILGAGLHGYSSARFLPVVVSAVFLVYFFRLKTKKERTQLVWMFLLVAVAAFFVFLPLFRYLLENPALFSYRASTRLLPIEQGYPGNPFLIFLGNFWKALTMFFYDNGEIWVHSIPNRPAFDIVSAAFYFMGCIFCIIHAVKQKNWLTTAILVSIPLLMMPSILSLVFPSENPSLNRPGGAYVLAFVVAGYGWVKAMELIFTHRDSKNKKVVISVFTVLLAVLCAAQNYDLVFHQYREQYDLKAWNTSEIATEIQRFYEEGGQLENAFVVPYPYWVDTRLVGINAGLPRKDYALWSEDIASTIQEPGTYLFIVKPEDTEALALIQGLFPNYSVFEYLSDTPGKDFIEIEIKN